MYTLTPPPHPTPSPHPLTPPPHPTPCTNAPLLPPQAQHKETGELAALKKVDIYDESELSDYTVEIDILADCVHKHIVGLHEAFFFEGTLWVSDEPLSVLKKKLFQKHLNFFLEFVLFFYTFRFPFLTLVWISLPFLFISWCKKLCELTVLR